MRKLIAAELVAPTAVVPADWYVTALVVGIVVVPLAAFAYHVHKRLIAALENRIETLERRLDDEERPNHLST